MVMMIALLKIMTLILIVMTLILILLRMMTLMQIHSVVRLALMCNFKIRTHVYNIIIMLPTLNPD